MNGRIRQGTRSELSGLGDIERAAGRLFPPGRIPDPEDSFPISRLEQAVDEGLLFVVDIAGSAVGFATCSLMNNRLHLDELSVHPDHGRRGYGRALVQKVIDTALERALDGVSLTTFADIPWNAPFYASMGFRTLPEAEQDVALLEALAHERAIGLTERVAMFRDSRTGIS
jgi:GNAT superfamily N-acetyltransferase